MWFRPKLGNPVVVRTCLGPFPERKRQDKAGHKIIHPNPEVMLAHCPSLISMTCVYGEVPTVVMFGEYKKRVRGEKRFVIPIGALHLFD